MTILCAAVFVSTDWFMIQPCVTLMSQLTIPNPPSIMSCNPPVKALAALCQNQLIIPFNLLSNRKEPIYAQQ